SPSGRTVVWVETLPPKDDTPSRSVLYLKEVATPTDPPRRLTAGDGSAAHDEHGVAWSPDGRQLAFLSDREAAGQLQVSLVAAAGGPAPKLTDRNGFLPGLRWSPDGKPLAALLTEGAPGPVGPTQAAPPEVGVVEEPAHRQRLTLIAPASGQARPLSPAGL